MKAKDKKSAPEHPWPTLGTKLAREARRKMENLTDEQRDEYFRRAMVLMYGGELTSSASPQ